MSASSSYPIINKPLMSSRRGRLEKLLLSKYDILYSSVVTNSLLSLLSSLSFFLSEHSPCSVISDRLLDIVGLLLLYTAHNWLLMFHLMTYREKSRCRGEGGGGKKSVSEQEMKGDVPISCSLQITFL